MVRRVAGQVVPVGLDLFCPVRLHGPLETARLTELLPDSSAGDELGGKLFAPTPTAGTGPFPRRGFHGLRPPRRSLSSARISLMCSEVRTSSVAGRCP